MTDDQGDAEKKVEDIGNGEELESKDLESVSGGMASFRKFSTKDDEVSACEPDCKPASGKTATWEAVEM